VPETVEAQLDNVFAHVGAMLDAAGATWGDIVKMNFWLAEAAHRPLLVAPWLAHFPHEASRPARHTQIIHGAALVTADFLAYVEDRP
jgi:enamine deaminase RidA (YjgF/YER057c/UK114 family)